MVQRVLVVGALIAAVLAFFAVHVGDLTSLRLGLLGLVLLCIAALV